jgi:hypothetical protein
MARGRSNEEQEEIVVEDVEVPEATAADTTEAGETAKADKPASKKDPLPDGWLTPTGLSHIVELKPQMVYGYVKNGKDFPSKLHTDGRVIVPVPAEGAEGYGEDATDARAWILNRRAKTEANKAAKAEKDAAAAAQAEATPEVESVEV